MTELARVRVGHPVATGLDMAIHRVPAELAIVVPTFNEAANVPLLVPTAALAALYPARLATRLPIAATLRDEVVS